MVKRRGKRKQETELVKATNGDCKGMARKKSEKTQDMVRNKDKAYCINTEHDSDT